MENQFYQAGYASFKDKKFEKALELYNKALELEPNNPDIYSDRGVLFFHMDDKLKALEDMNKSVELQPDYAYRYSSRAYIKDSLGDTEGAVEDYRIAVKLDPEDAVAYNNLGMLEEKLGYKAQAEKRYKRADELAKQEDQLQAQIRDMEAGGVSESSEMETKAEPEKADPPKQTKGKIIRGVLTDRKQFKEFLKFVRNGLKDPGDQSPKTS